jgi:mannose-6-phosphate isomerase-like protein (cupin superfamily)
MLSMVIQIGNHIVACQGPNFWHVERATLRAALVRARMAPMDKLPTRSLPGKPDTIAPDGSEVRLLTALPRASMAHFRLQPGQVARAAAHRTVEELWFFTRGRGRMWRKLGEEELTVEVAPGTSIAIPLGASFQFRVDGDEPLEAVGATIPPWPGDDEAYFVDGPWAATV